MLPGTVCVRERSSMRSNQDIEQAIDAYGDAVYRACFLYFKSQPDVEDAFQDTFIKYSLYDGDFKDSEHKKAWLIRVATNVCKDALKASSRKNIELDEEVVENIESKDLSEDQPGSIHTQVIEAMRALTDPPRTPVYLAVYEGYTAPEISEMLDAPVNTVYSWISRGKNQLKEALS